MTRLFKHLYSYSINVLLACVIGNKISGLWTYFWKHSYVEMKEGSIQPVEHISRIDVDDAHAMSLVRRKE